jgi:hypothetical protein
MRSAKRCTRFAIAGVAAAALVTACGSSSGGKSSGGSVVPSGGSSSSSPGGSGGSDSQALLAASVAKTLAATNAKMHFDFNESISGQDTSFVGDGVIDFAGKKSQVSLNLPAGSAVSGTIEERMIGKQIYVKLPASASSSTGGKPWITLDGSSFGLGSSGQGVLGQDPTQFLTTLRSVSDSIIKVGTEDIRGVQTTHYRAQVDLTKAAAVSGANTTSLDQYKKLSGSGTLPEDVYIDANGLTRRFSVSVASPATGAVKVTVDFYDFGGADTSGIVAPPADEVGTLSDVTGGLGSG